MIKRLLGVLGAAAALSGFGAMMARPVAALQGPTPTFCQGGAAPITTTATSVVGGELVPIAAGVQDPVGGVVPQFFNVFIPEVETVTTTQNYHGVVGLTYVVTVNSLHGTTTRLLAPLYLEEAYGFRDADIAADLASGFLKDRGPCL